MINRDVLDKAFMIATHNGFQQRAEEPDIFKIPEAFIYRHDFAKALWGEKNYVEPATKANGGNKRIHYGMPNWKHHIQEMVVAHDPIKYLGENI